MGYFKQAVIGTGWLGALRVLTRGFGFLKIAILARLLTPEDFGIFGVATISLAFLETFTEPGVSLALVQQEEEIDDYLNTAWVISILRGALIALIIFFLAVPIAGFFRSPEAVKLLRLIALVPLIRGFLNPGAVNFIKKLDFRNEFLLRSLPMLVDITTAIIVSLKLRSPEAIVYGMLAGAMAELVFSFLLPRLRPKFLLITKQAKKLLNFGKWVTWGWIMGYLGEQFDDILVGRFLGTTSLGVYQMAFKLSVLPSSELGEVVAKVAFPVYSKIAGDRRRAAQALLKTTGLLIGLAFPVILVTILFPEFIIRIALGEQWLGAAGILRILAVYGFIRTQGQAASAMLYALGKPDVAAKLRTFRFVLMVAALYPGIYYFGLTGAAWAVVLSALPPQPVMWYKLRNLLKQTGQA